MPNALSIHPMQAHICEINTVVTCGPSRDHSKWASLIRLGLYQTGLKGCVHCRPPEPRRPDRLDKMIAVSEWDVSVIGGGNSFMIMCLEAP